MLHRSYRTSPAVAQGPPSEPKPHGRERGPASSHDAETPSQRYWRSPQGQPHVWRDVHGGGTHQDRGLQRIPTFSPDVNLFVEDQVKEEQSRIDQTHVHVSPRKLVATGPPLRPQTAKRSNDNAPASKAGALIRLRIAGTGGRSGATFLLYAANPMAVKTMTHKSACHGDMLAGACGRAWPLSRAEPDRPAADAYR